MSKWYRTVADFLSSVASARDPEQTWLGGAFRYRQAFSSSNYYDVINKGGVRFHVIGTCVELSAFGFTGDGTTTDTARAQKALDWLARERGRTLVWDVIDAEIAGELTLPDASEWCVHFPLPTRITQKTDNTPIFVMEYDDYKFGFGFSGETVWCQWENDQTSSEPNSIGVAFKPTADVSHGVFHFQFAGLHNENGYDLIGLHPAATGYTSPFWGYRIGTLFHQTQASGRVFNLNSGVSAGAPAGIIDKVYVKGTNAAQPCFVVTAQPGVRVNSFEINGALGRVGEITSCRNFSVGMLRFEGCVLENAEDLFVFAGSSCRATIENVEFQTVTTAAGAHVFGIKVDVAAQLAVTGSVSVNNCSASSTGDFFAFKPNASSGQGTIVLPPLLDVQTSDADVRLYDLADADHITYSSAVALGPWVLDGVSGVASYTPMQSAYDGANNYFDVIAPCDGWLVGLNVYCDAAVTAGSIAFRPMINGSAVGSGGMAASLSSGQDASAYAVAVYSPASINATHRVVRGDRIRVAVSPSSATGGGKASASVLIAAAP
ncbi:hypothetical protein [Tropicimonas marinistellae]|uniref:hypothetical protein n=1 Tax=Tropicimonas marinistellae TaxID=1739787 RepID=UPI00083463DE|nr:hypothetical protein [Tropicimonas marinistellae]